MSPRAIIWGGVMAAMAVVFVVCLRATLILQTERGAAFPPYSSLRADPLGARALYEALARVPGVAVEQNTRDLRFLKADGNTALFILGIDETPDHIKDLQTIENFVADGGRLIIAYAIRGGFDWFCLSEEDAEAIRQAGEEDGEIKLRRWINRNDVPALAPRDEPSEDDEDYIDFDEELASRRWGFRVVAPMDSYDFADTEEIYAKPSPEYAFAAEIPWKSPEYFLPMHPAWRAIYTAGPDDRPVMMSRNYGKGRIIVASDSYLYSNEAMRNDRQPELLAWLLGDARHIVFEETTKGVSHEPGLMAMLRRYRLHGLVAAAALVALLVAWRGSVSLLPRRTEAQERERALVLLGRDAHAGLATLLRAAAPRDDLLRVCYAEWQRTAGRGTRATPGDREVAQGLATQSLDSTTAAAKDFEVLQRYLHMSDLLREKHAPKRERSVAP